MDTFNTEAWRDSTIIQVTWAIEAVDHTISLGDIGVALQKSEEDNGKDLFSRTEDYDFGVAAIETWMLPEAEYTRAFGSLIAEAKESEEKDFWLVPNNYSGILNPVYDSEKSFRIDSYLPEQLRPNAETVHMSTTLMLKYFPFLRRAENFIHATGYFLETDKSYFFVADGNSPMFADKEFVKIFPVDETVTFDGLNSGDKVGIVIETVGALFPRVTDIHQIDLIDCLYIALNVFHGAFLSANIRYNPIIADFQGKSTLFLVFFCVWPIPWHTPWQ